MTTLALCIAAFCLGCAVALHPATRPLVFSADEAREKAWTYFLVGGVIAFLACLYQVVQK